MLRKYVMRLSECVCAQNVVYVRVHAIAHVFLLLCLCNLVQWPRDIICHRDGGSYFGLSMCPVLLGDECTVECQMWNVDQFVGLV